MRRLLTGCIALLLVALAGFAPIVSRAQDASPTGGVGDGSPTVVTDTGTPSATTGEASPVGDATGGPVMQGQVVASALTSPRGILFDPDGTMWVALAGSGGPNAATEQSPAFGLIGPLTGGPTAAVARIENGCPVAAATGLPSMIDATGGVLGAESLALLDGQLYVSVDGGGPSHGNPDQPSGIYRVNDDGTTELVADLSTWLRNNPAKVQPPDYDPDADGFWMVADQAAGEFWVLEPNSGGVLTVKPDGAITRVIDWSEEHPVPSAIALSGDGGVYVGMLTPVPYLDGKAFVRKVMPDGTATDVWTGLTMVTGLAVDEDGVLYATEMATGNINTPPFIAPGTGKVVRQSGQDSSEDVATGLDFPIGLTIGPDWGIYTSSPAVGAGDGSGVVIRVAMAKGTPVAGEPATQCSPIPETLSQANGSASPSPEMSATPAVALTPSGSASPGAASATEGTMIDIRDHAFNPDTVTIKVGETVTWTNHDTVKHSATSDDGTTFDSQPLDPGQSYSHTFTEAGTFTYHCEAHPDMKGTITVEK